MLLGQTDLITDQLPNNMYLDNFRNEKEEITRVPSASADRMNVDRRGSRGDSLNKPAQLKRIKMKALEYMSQLEAAPGEATPVLQLCVAAVVACGIHAYSVQMLPIQAFSWLPLSASRTLLQF